MVRTSLLAAVVERVRQIERGEGRRAAGTLPFGLLDLDRRLPDGGLPLGALHDIRGEDHDGFGAAAALFLAGILARLDGPVLWAARRADLFAPGLARAGLDPGRVLFAEASDTLAVLRAMEEGLRETSLAAAVGEVSRLDATAARRLQLAAGQSGVTAFALRRWQKRDDTGAAFAVTRWRVGPVPSDASHVGLGRARWRLDLVRCRGGEPFSWIVESCDATGRLALSANLGDGQGAAHVGRAAG